MRWCQCLEGPESEPSYRQTHLGRDLSLHKPHWEYETPDGGKNKFFQQTAPGPRLVPETVSVLAKEILCQHYWWQDATWMWVSEGPERDPARVLTERNEETRKMKGNEVTWKKTDGSNWFYSISNINVAELRGFSESYIFVLLFKYNILLQFSNLTF